MNLSRHMVGIESSDIRKWSSVIEAKGGVNLAQGNCFIEPLEYFGELSERVREAIESGRTKSGYNTYAHASGVTVLREAVAKKAKEFNGIDADPDLLDGNIVVTCGATGALACALEAIIDPGDEVIFFEPFYNYHLKSLQMCMGVPSFVQLRPPKWGFDREDLERAWSPRTKAVLVTNPSNPTGKVFTRDELQTILDFAADKDIAVITDEVYEFITFEGRPHISLGSLPGAAERTITITAYSKTLASTGWRLGYAIAPKQIANRMRIANEMNYICAPTPLQHAVAPLTENWQAFLHLGPLFQRKRDMLLQGLAAAGFTGTMPDGAYYVLCDVTKLGFKDSIEANLHLIDQFGIAGVPGYGFYEGDGGKQIIRFCFAHTDEGLRRAMDSLCAGS